MCLNPLRIANKALKFHPGPTEVNVPCGKCIECQQQKSMDYFLRAWEVYKDTVCKGGWSAFFCTFTYNDGCLPKTQFARYVIKENDDIWVEPLKGTYPTFNHVDTRRCLKNICQDYRRRGLPKPYYLLTCEYGEKHHRPHYHCLFFVPEIITFPQFQEYLKRFWHYGFTSSFDFKLFEGKRQSRSPQACIQYVVKYVSKGSTWQPDFMKYVGTDVIPIGNEWSNIVPRVFSSNGFGSSLEKRLTHANYESGKYLVEVDGKVKPYSIPSYYRRRYFNDVVVDERKKVLERHVEIFRISPRHYNAIFVSDHKLKQKTHTIYKNGYLDVKRTQLYKQLGIDYFNAECLFRSPSKALVQFCDSKDYDLDKLSSVFRFSSLDKYRKMWIHYKWSNVPLDFDFEDSRQTISYDTDLNFVDSCMFSTYLFNDVESAIKCYREFDIFQREIRYERKKEADLEYYKRHLITKNI